MNKFFKIVLRLLTSLCGFYPYLYGQSIPVEAPIANSAEYLGENLQKLELIKIKLRQVEVYIKDDFVYLSDVADCAGSESICEEILGSTLADKPDLNQSLIIQQKKILDQIKEEWPHIKIEVQGPSYIKLLAFQKKVTPEYVSEKFSQRLKEVLPPESKYRIYVQHLSFARPIIAKNEHFEVYFPLLEEPIQEDILNGLLNSRMIDLVIHESDENASQAAETNKYSAYVRLRVERQIPVAAKNLKEGAIISSEDVLLKWTELNRHAQQEYISQQDLKKTLILKNNIAAGQPIRLSSLAKEETMRRGAVVTYLVNSQNLQLSGSAKALSSAEKGETVDLESLDGRKKFKAIVLDSKTASLRL
ncbi:MAG: flagellar basal body P-ring formation protein FlgA [Oligoflexales bacterium]|nr:flagellar basal body P-ring formation protein FlgA [Oligoflexales bacterium]